MRKSPSPKHRAIHELKTLIRLSRKAARQVNRKLESLAKINTAKQIAKERLIRTCGLK